MNGEEVAGVVGAHERRDVKTSVLWGVPLPTPAPRTHSKVKISII